MTNTTDVSEHNFNNLTLCIYTINTIRQTSHTTSRSDSNTLIQLVSIVYN